MKRAPPVLGCLFLASQAAAQQPSPAQMGITPTTNPEALQVLDSTKTWVPLGGVNPVTHTFTPVGGGGGGGGAGIPEVDISVTDPTVGMTPGGADNSPHLSALMNKMSSGTGAYTGYDVVFNGVQGQKYTEYYFTQPFLNSRMANYHCQGGMPYPSTYLVFAPGIDGFVEEVPAVTPDGGTGGGTISNCGIYSMGFGQGMVDPHSPSTITSVAFYGDPAGSIPTSTWSVGDGIILVNVGNANMPASAIIAAPLGTTIASVSGSTVTLSSPVDPSFGQALQGASATAAFTQTATNNFANNDTITVGPTTYTFQTAALTPLTPQNHVLVGVDFPTSAANLLAAVNGTAGEYNTYSPNLTGEYQYLHDSSVKATYASGVITFTSLFTGLNTNSFPSTAVTAAGTFGGATFSGANPNALAVRFYQLPLSQAFKIQTTAGSTNVAVVSGPRKLYGGDVLVSDALPFGATVFGPISGTAGAQTFTVTGSTGGNQVNASVTHAAGAEGNAWLMPAALRHRTTATSAIHLATSNFPIGVSLACSSGGGVNCDLTRDEDLYHTNHLVGRWVSGNNTSTSASINESFSHNYITDVFEGATLGEAYFNLNSNSVENNNAKWSSITNCANQNFSLVFGGYVFGGANGCTTAGNVLDISSGGLFDFWAIC